MIFRLIVCTELFFKAENTPVNMTRLFNTTDWIWNARVERSWLNGRLTAKVDAYDILNRINNVNVRINSLGRTETWTNSMSRYVLLTLAWRFSIMPKKS